MIDCNKIQANNLACNKISLTEQLKKGELPEGWYWVRIKTWCEYITMLYYTSDIFLDGDVPVDNDKIIEVLAPVPSYDELQNMNKAVNECMAANIKLVEQNTQLKEQINKWCLDAINRGTANAVKAVKEFGMPERIKELVEENAQLKELLKACKDIFDECFSPSAKYGELYKKIDEALK